MIFQPDNHFVNEVSYSPLPSTFAEALCRLVYELYPVSKQSAPLLSLSGPNVNAKNFRWGSYFIKAVPCERAPALMPYFEIIQTSLKNNKVPTISFLVSKNKRSIETGLIENIPYFICLMPFLEDHYFPGTIASFDAVLQIMPALEAATRSLKIPKDATQIFERWEPLALLQQVEKVLAGPIEADPFNDFITQEWENIEHSLKTAVSSLSKADDWGIFHYDLHPHNLLFQGDLLKAVLDLESFKFIPAKASRGLMAFKLARKCLSISPSSMREIKERISPLGDGKILFEGANIELARRISVILEWHFLKKCKDWDQDLPKHVSGLKEIQALFQ